MLVLVAFRAQAHGADHADHELAPERSGHLLVVDDHLNQARAIAQVHEGHTAVIATTVDPTGERHLLADQRFSDFGGVMCSVSRLAHAASTP